MNRVRKYYQVQWSSEVNAKNEEQPNFQKSTNRFTIWINLLKNMKVTVISVHLKKVYNSHYI